MISDLKFKCAYFYIFDILQERAYFKIVMLILHILSKFSNLKLKTIDTYNSSSNKVGICKLPVISRYNFCVSINYKLQKNYCPVIVGDLHSKT